MGSSSSKPTQTKQSQPVLTTEKKPQVIAKPKESTKPSQTPIINQKQLKTLVTASTQPQTPKNKQDILVQEYFQQLQTFWTTDPTLVQIRKHQTIFNQKYLTPIKKGYNEIPEEISNIKFSYLTQYDYRDRLTALGLAAMIVGVASYRRFKLYQYPARAFTALRDSTLAYLIGGLVIAPEIYNPLMQD